MSSMGKWNSKGAKGSMSVRAGMEQTLGSFMVLVYVEGEGIFMINFGLGFSGIFGSHVSDK